MVIYCMTLSNNPKSGMGREVGDSFKSVGTWVNLWLIHVDAW